MKSRRGEGWTEQDDNVIRRMAEANASAILIAAKLRRTTSSVMRRAMAKGIKLRSRREQRAVIRRAEQEASH